MLTNREIAEQLRQAADLLQQQEANPFRVGAHRRARDTVVHLDQDIRDIALREGMDGLVELPHIGKGIARSIYELVTTGRWSQLERLRGTLDSVKLFQTIPILHRAISCDFLKV